MASALASRTVSWNPVSFAQVAAEAESVTDATLTATSRSAHSRNSAADYAPGMCLSVQMVVYVGANAVFTSVAKHTAAQLITLSHVEFALKTRIPLMTGAQC